MYSTWFGTVAGESLDTSDGSTVLLLLLLLGSPCTVSASLATLSVSLGQSAADVLCVPMSSESKRGEGYAQKERGI